MNYDPFKDLAAVSGSVELTATGAGSASHLASIDMTHMPYKGGAPALQDLLGEHVNSYFATPPAAPPLIRAGILILPLATTGLTRPSYIPKIPAVAEAGYPGFEALNWYTFVAPARRLRRCWAAGTRRS